MDKTDEDDITNSNGLDTLCTIFMKGWAGRIENGSF